MHRYLVALTATALVVAGCSGADEEPTSVTAAVDAPVSTTPGGAPPVPGVSSSPEPPPSPLTVSLEIDGAELGVQVELVGDVAAADDPFGDVAVCSGHAAQIGSYLVGVGTAAGPVRWASVATADRVVGAGSYDADVRLELGSGEVVDAFGSLTLEAGLASGSFVAATVDGAALRGEFDCVGGEPSITGASGTVVGLVEVVALLQRGAAERVVSVVSDDPEVVVCGLGAGGVPRLVEVSGMIGVGSITAFELDVTGADGALVLTTAGTTYRSDDVVVALADDGVAGTFSASTGGVSIDGAFSCTSP